MNFTMVCLTQIFRFCQSYTDFWHQSYSEVTSKYLWSQHMKIILMDLTLLKLLMNINKFHYKAKRYYFSFKQLYSHLRKLKLGVKTLDLLISNQFVPWQFLDKYILENYNFIAVMSQVQKQQQTNILAIIDKLYEHRSASQHNRLVSFVMDMFAGTITQRMAKLFSFYLQRVTGPVTLTSKQFCSQSFIIIGSFTDASLQNPESQFKIHHISKQKKVTIQPNQQAIVLDYLHYLNCQSLGESSIQQQISFMHASQFLCSIPKRRLYHILRKAIILKYSFNQTIYHEGQQIQPGQSGSGVYLVRKGDFGYFKQSQKQAKQIQTLSFSKGHLFGTLQLFNGQVKQTIAHRQFTVKCKSHSGLIYRISQQIFNTQIKPYCQNVINNRQSKLYKYLDNQVDSINKVRQQKSHLLSHTLTKGFGSTTQSINFNDSTEFPLLTRTRLSVPNVETTSSFKPLLSQRIQQQGLRKTNYLSLTKQGPLKVYPMISQRSNFTESQFKQFNRLTRNKQACERIKFLQTRGKSSGSKGQILFSFFKQTWNFDKQKKMMAHNRRYA